MKLGFYWWRLANPDWAGPVVQHAIYTAGECPSVVWQFAVADNTFLGCQSDATLSAPLGTVRQYYWTISDFQKSGEFAEPAQFPMRSDSG